MTEPHTRPTPQQQRPAEQEHHISAAEQIRRGLLHGAAAALARLLIESWWPADH
ncbi:MULTISPECIES: hypothetical protein [Streptomyces]|uniref:hypothetical protein n=1 Tax=Streptomyces TaxID=1883 RepID=UPI00131D6605|nr:MULTISPECIES: hypothetical protein [Streptomyces]MCH0559353.1 hypothetical protein [Streptomyces sp. MUM 16J]